MAARIAITWLIAAAFHACPAPVVPLQAPERWEALADTLFRHYGREQGIGLPIVTALAQDGQGFLWVGTQAGLARWDGYRFRTYLPDPMVAGALPDNFITVLLTDHQGVLWIGTNSGGVARFDARADRFVTPAAAAGAGAVGMIYALADGGSEGILVGSAGGLSRIERGARGDTILPVTASGPAPSGLVTALLHDRAGTLWIGTDGGLLKRDPHRAGTTPVRLADDGRREPRVDSLLETSDGRLWIGTHDRGVLILDPAKGQVRALPLRLHAQQHFHEYITSLVEVAPGEVWVGSHGDGILAVDTRSGTTRALRHEAAVASSLSENTVLAMLKDESGELWVGTYSGLDSAGPLQSAFLTLQGGVHAEGIAASAVDALAVGIDGRIWAGLYNKGLDILDPVGGTVQHLRVGPPGSRAMLPDQPVLALARGAAGRMIIGSDGGVYVASADGREVHAMVARNRNPGAGSNGVAVVDGALWVGGLDDGLWRFGGEDGRHAWRIEGLTDDRIQSIQPQEGGALWVGTNNGLNIVDPVSGRVRQVATRSAGGEGLSGGLIGSVLRDRSGRMWVAVMGGGIDIIDGWASDTVPRLHHLGTRDGLPHANVDTLLLDDHGDIWASTDNGLARIDPVTLAIRAFHRADGVGITDYFTHTAIKTADGELLFGGTGGVTVVRPARVQAWTYRPPLVVTEVRVGGSSLPPGRFNGPAADQTGAEVPAEHNSFSVEFAGLDYSEPGLNRYAYRLEGYDRDWIHADSEHRTATYTNLPPGTYRLKLRGTNRAGDWFERPVPIRITVAAYWYQTVWFRCAMTVLVLIAVYLLLRWRTAFLEVRRRELEAEVGRKTEALQSANDELEVRYVELGQQRDSLAAQRDELAAYRSHAEAEAEVASFLVSRLTRADQLNDPCVQHFWLPAEAFSGDVIATGRSSTGDLYGMLADATGHGLAAAINLIPLTSAFYAMASKGFNLQTIADQLNKVVKEYSLADRFVAVTLVHFSARDARLEVVNAGNPAALLLDAAGAIEREFRSTCVPLGILPRPAFKPAVESLALAGGERLVVFSDGLVEASDREGRQFAPAGIRAALCEPSLESDPVSRIRTALYAHLGESVPADDVSLLVLSDLRPVDTGPVCLPSLARDSAKAARKASGWRVEVAVHWQELRGLELVPVLVELTRTLGLNGVIEARLFTILSELFHNALEHGLLGLDSRIKGQPDGFERYLALRAERLAALCEGAITVSVEHIVNGPEDGTLAVVVTDTGPGFDHRGLLGALAVETDAVQAGRPWGRGIALLNRLCDRIRFNEDGNSVTVELAFS